MKGSTITSFVIKITAHLDATRGSLIRNHKFVKKTKKIK